MVGCCRVCALVSSCGLQAGHQSVDIPLPIVGPRTTKLEAIDHDTGSPVDVELTSRFLDAIERLGLMRTMGCLRLARREVRWMMRNGMRGADRCGVTTVSGALG